VKNLLAAAAFALLCSPGLLHAETQGRLSLNPGFGMLIAGDKYSTGGFAFTGSVLLGVKFNETIGIAYENSANLTTFKSVANMGLLDVNALMFTVTPSEHFIFDIGPSVDFFTMVLCSNEPRCGRETGFAPGGNIYLTFLKDKDFGVAANVHGLWVPATLYKGPMFTTNIGPVWAW
jgi:hypothetical protein